MTTDSRKEFEGNFNLKTSVQQFQDIKQAIKRSIKKL